MTTILLTGATDGIGRQTADDLVERGAQLVIHGRSREKLDRVTSELQAKRSGSVVASLVADLSRLDEVRRLAADAAAIEPGIDVLLANAGVFMNERVVTKDGYEASFAVSHLAHLLLAQLLLPTLRRSSDGRVVFVASVAHQRGRIDFDDYHFEKQPYGAYEAYARAKLANVMTAAELARRLGGSPAVFSLHPGVVSTKLLREGFGMQGPDSHEEGAATSVHLALDPEVRAHSGRYFVKKAVAATNPIVGDTAATARLYEDSCRMLGLEPLPLP
jgi:retinol dehydrogenase 14